MARQVTLPIEKEITTPYDECFDGSVWEVDKGVDYTGITLFAIKRIRYCANKKNLKIKVVDWDDNHIKFYAIPRE